MTVFSAESFDVAVIGAGHAGIEAALAAARLGCKNSVFFDQFGRRRQYAVQSGDRRHS